MTKRLIGLIAGQGDFPQLFATEARRLGRRVIAVGFEGETDSKLSGLVDEMHWVKIGQLGKLLQTLKRSGVHEVAMLGTVRHVNLFRNVRPDLRAAKLLARAKFKTGGALLGLVADEIEREGLHLVSTTQVLSEQIARRGPLTHRRPTKAEEADLEFGTRIAKGIAGLDIGQTVVVKDRAVVAVEAMEGTDECIRRGAIICGPGAVVVKMARPKQDPRFDLPAVGPRTVRILAEVRAAVLGVESGQTLILEREMVAAEADTHGIAIVGL